MKRTLLNLGHDYRGKLELIKTYREARSLAHMNERLIDAELKRIRRDCEHLDFEDNLTGAKCRDCGLETEICED